MKRRNTLPPSDSYELSTLPPSSKILKSDEDTQFDRFKSGRGSSENGFRRAYADRSRKLPKIFGPVLEPPANEKKLVEGDKLEGFGGGSGIGFGGGAGAPGPSLNIIEGRLSLQVDPYTSSNLYSAHLKIV